MLIVLVKLKGAKKFDKLYALRRKDFIFDKISTFSLLKIFDFLCLKTVLGLKKLRLAINQHYKY